VQTVTQFAAANVFTSLGIDWQMLLLQIVAFLILVWAMGKWVYPWLVKNVDERQQKIEEANNAAEKAKTDAAEAETKLEALLADARQEAIGIVETARQESDSLIAAAEEKARLTAERIVADAHEQLERDVAVAQKALRDQTLELVGMAAEKVIGKASDAKLDNSLIAEALKEAE